VRSRPNSDVVTVVDDDPRIRESIADLLASAGYTPRSYSSADELLQARGLETCFCLITDVRMPGSDGWELQRVATANFPSLPVILITALQDETTRVRALALGAFALIFKPFDGEELLQAVDAARECSGGDAAHPYSSRKG